MEYNANGTALEFQQRYPFIAGTLRYTLPRWPDSSDLIRFGLSSTHLSREDTTAALAQKAATDQEVGDGVWDPSVPIEERLEDAKAFFTMVDPESYSYLGYRWKEIDDYLRWLSDNKVECKVRLYDEVATMARVTKWRLDRQARASRPSTGINMLPPYSQRLPSDHDWAKLEAEKDEHKEDKPPFTVDRKPDQGHFLAVMRSPCAEGINLRNVERLAYRKTLKNPHQCNAWLQNKTFEQRAEKRGRRRAAIQVALQTLCRNSEQNFESDSERRMLILPQRPSPEPREPEMFKALPESERPASPDPFEFTKKNIRFQQDQKRIEDLEQSTRQNARAEEWKRSQHSAAKLKKGSESKDMTQLYVFDKPTLSRGVLKAKYEKRFRVFVNLLFDLMLSDGPDLFFNQGSHPGSAIRHALKVIYDLPRNHVSYKIKLSFVKVLANCRDEAFVDGLNNGRTSAPLTEEEISKIEEYVVIEGNINLVHQDLVSLIAKFKNELGSLLRQLSINTFDQDIKPLLEESGRCLQSWREDAQAYSPWLKTEGSHLSLEELAQLFGNNPDVLTHEEALSFLNKKIIQENANDQRSCKLNHEVLWSFTKALPVSSKGRRFFSLERWSGFKRPSAQTPPHPQARFSDPAPEPYFHDPTHLAVPYTSRDPRGPTPSDRVPPPEIGFTTIIEDSRPHTPEIDEGSQIPDEIPGLDFGRNEGRTLGQSGRTDPEEVYVGDGKGEGRAEFGFGETRSMQSMLGRKIQMDLEKDPVKAARLKKTKISPYTSNRWALPEAEPSLRILPDQSALPSPELSDSSIATSSNTGHRVLKRKRKDSP
ncbi:MAG: hypothetical protein M1827_006636 [Pycnora praestabilis]|nr:MAG: hypothetical protein M1827_006636 [Pycnora praestabilis]